MNAPSTGRQDGAKAFMEKKTKAAQAREVLNKGAKAAAQNGPTYGRGQAATG